MKKSLFKNWWLLLVRGIILIILSVFVFRNHGASLLGLSIYIGIAYLFSGIISSVGILSYRKEIDHWGWSLASGLFDILFGILFLTKPELTVSFMVLMLGFWFVFYSIVGVMGSIALKGGGVKNWWIDFAGGIMGVVFGFLIILNPFAGAFTIIWILGFALLVIGILNIVAAFLLKSAKE